VNRQIIHVVLVMMVLITASVFFSCDTTSNKHPITIINVHLTPAVDADHKLYAVFHFLPDWASPWLVLSSDTNTILLPPLNVGTLPLYMEIIYNTNGFGDSTSSNNYYQGWYGKTIRSGPGAQPLDPFIIPKVPLMILNVDLDIHGTLP
jgi:hypothetical protein